MDSEFLSVCVTAAMIGFLVHFECFGYAATVFSFTALIMLDTIRNILKGK